jgi:uncharacterized repeat protein (TIGR01451 family)
VAYRGAIRFGIAVPLVVFAYLILAATPAGATVPGMPRVPQAPTSVFHEDFEHEVSLAPVSLTDYVGRPTGAPGVHARYTADPPWRTDCNGTIVAFDSPDGDWSPAGCPQPTAATGAWAYVRMMAWAMGIAQGDGATAARANHAVTAWTYTQDPGAGLVQLATRQDTPITFPQKHSRFITFSIDGAELCAPPGEPGAHNVAKFEFFLANLEGKELQAFSEPIEPCADPRARTITAPGVGNRPAGATFKVGTFASDDAVLFSGAGLGIAMRNAQGLSYGNDAAFDDIRVIDATPQLDKSFSPTVLNRGETSILTFTVTNTSDLAAKDGWSFTDTLPAGLTVVPGGEQVTDCPGGAITASGGTISVRGSLAAEQEYCEVHVAVTSPTNGTFTNGPGDVTVEGVNPPGEATVEFGDADLSVAKSASEQIIEPGSDITYTLKVTNHGPNAAENVVVTDPLDGLSGVSADPECDLGQGLATCRLSSLGVGESHTFTVVAHVPGTHRGGVENTATVTSDTPDPYLGNNEDSAIVHTRAEADLAIVKRASAHRVRPGDEVTYTLLVTNRGPHDAHGVLVTDRLSRELELISAHPSQGSCDIRFGLVCRLGTVAGGAGAQIRVTARVGQTAVGKVRNVATVDGEETDPNPGDNSDDETIEVTPEAPRQHVADLEVTKHASRVQVEAGGQVTYFLRIANHGPDPAADARLIDTASSARKIVSVDPSQGTCHVATVLTCDLGRIEPGSHATVKVVAALTHPGAEQNTAAVTTAELDPRPENDVASATVKVIAALRLTKTASPSTIVAGQTVTFDIRVKNPTTGPIKGVSVCDSLPSGLVFLRAAPTTSRHGGAHCWTIVSLPGGASRTLTLTARARHGAAGPLTNVATATALGARPARAEATVEVGPAIPPDSVVGLG